MNKGTNCPICHRISEASFPEKTLYFYIKKVFNDTYASHIPQWLKGAEIDIYIPSINYGIEYDGEYWHSNKNHKDKWKTRQCTKHGINLIRIRESGLGLLNDGSTEYLVDANNYERNDYTELHNIISDIIRYLGKDPSNLDFTEYTYAMYLAERDELIASIMENENNLSLQKLNRQQKKKQVFASHHQPSKRLPSLDQRAPDFIHEWHPTKLNIKRTIGQKREETMKKGSLLRTNGYSNI
jgi:very-short-patch-repair endonuclease